MLFRDLIEAIEECSRAGGAMGPVEIKEMTVLVVVINQEISARHVGNRVQKFLAASGLIKGGEKIGDAGGPVAKVRHLKRIGFVHRPFESAARFPFGDADQVFPGANSQLPRARCMEVVGGPKQEQTRAARSADDIGRITPFGSVRSLLRFLVDPPNASECAVAVPSIMSD